MLRGSTWKELIPGIDDPLLSPSPGCTSTCPESLSLFFFDSTKMIMNGNGPLSTLVGMLEYILMFTVRMGLH